MVSSSYLIPQVASDSILKQDVDEFFTAYNAAFASANTVAVQRTFGSSLQATLPEDQGLAASHATTFLNGWGFGVGNAVLGGLGTIAASVVGLIDRGLLPTAKRLDRLSQGTTQFDSSLKDFRDYLQTIVATCCKLDPDSGSLLLSIQSIQNRLASLAPLIADDRTKLDTAVVEVRDDDKIQDLLAQQKELQDELAGVNTQLAQGATSMIASNIAFGFSFATPFLPGVDSGAVAGSALAIVGEAQEIERFNEENKQLFDQQSSLGTRIVALVETITKDTQDQLELTLVVAQIDILAKQIDGLHDDIGSVLAQMTDWAKQIVLLSEQTAPPSLGFYTAQVTAGRDFWSKLQGDLHRYQSILARSTR